MRKTRSGRNIAGQIEVIHHETSPTLRNASIPRYLPSAPALD